MSERKVSLTLIVYDATDAEARDVAREMFEAFWGSRHTVTLDELTVDGEPAYEDVKRAYFEQAKKVNR